MGVSTVNWQGRFAILGWGVSGKASARALLARGAQLRAFDGHSPDTSSHGEALTPAQPDELTDVEVVYNADAHALSCEAIAWNPDCIVVSPGIPAHHPIFSASQDAGIPVIGEVELAWRLQEDSSHAGRPWLCVTGTNGKTTTVGMLGSILRASGARVAEVGNIGLPICEAVDTDAEVFAVELSSFQLHTVSTVSPLASVCLNVDADHLDWHGSAEAYAADKAKVYHATQVACFYPSSDIEIEHMVAEADVIEGARAIGLTLGIPSISQVGWVEDALVERAFVERRHMQAQFLAEVDDLRIAYHDGVTDAARMDATAAAGLARAYGVSPEAVAQGLRDFHPADHRRAVISHAADVTWIDDSKATNAHAAAASLRGITPGTAIWIAGGDTKGQEFGDLVAKIAPQLRGVVVIGEDRSAILRALAQYAPTVPFVEVDGHEDWMFSVVNEAVALSRPGDTVVLAPACASWDQFRSYAQRGEVFREAVARLEANWAEQ